MAYFRTKSLMTVGFSGITSNAYYIGDADSISVSLTTATTDSAYTLQGSSADGFAEAIPANAWSTLSVLGAQGIFGIQPGARWLRAIEPASSSSATVFIAQRVGQ